MKIGLVLHALRLGGVDTWALRLGAWLQNAGYEVELITTQGPGEWFEKIAENGLVGRRIDRPAKFPSPFHAIRVGRVLAAQNYDVLLFNNARFANRGLGFLPDRTKVAAVIHNHWNEDYRAGLGNFEGLNCAVAVSPQIRSEIALRVPRLPVVEIPYGVPLPSQTDFSARAPWKLPLQILFAGRFNSQKGVEFLAPIIEKLAQSGSNFEFRLAGDGEELPGVQKTLKALKLKQKIEFLGRQSPENIQKLLLQSHVLLLPSRFEGLPITLLEAQGAGCVPVASRLPGSTDAAVLDAKTGFLVPFGEVSAFAAALEQLARDGNLWAAMSAAARARAEEKFSLEVMGRAYQSLIEALMAEKYPAARARKSLRPRVWRGYKLPFHAP